ncbi:hypothetical protein [Streptacidiphilus rugosus]|uniref:hypothetical protein n=1 Tax=Streptacidiphilus rugosus TaxID=405783 RepID=UPI0012F83A07|nr:hypothetical protein [Streptacidiphilus rugosus]
MSGNDDVRIRDGLRRKQSVRCRVTGHRGRFGVEVSVVTPGIEVPAFIDFVNLTDSPEHPLPEDFPAIGSVLDAVVLDVMSSGELRLAVCSQWGVRFSGGPPVR